MVEARRTIELSGSRCRALREARGLSRDGMARLSHGPEALSVPTIKRAESGHRIYLSSARAIAQLLDIAVSDLTEPDTNTGKESPTCRQASIAVMPFEANDLTHEARVFADGLAEDLISRLSRHWFPVLARSSTFSLKGKTLQSREVGARLGAQYLVEGSVRQDDSMVRVNARLVEADSNRQLWADIADAPREDCFRNQDYFCHRILNQIGHQVLSHEAERARRRSPLDQDAWGLALRGTWHYHRASLEENKQAQECLGRALELDEAQPLARYMLILSHQRDLLNQWSSDPEATRQQMWALSQKFERLFPDNPWMHVASAYSCVARGERPEAMHRLQEALDFDPNLVQAHSLYGQLLSMSSEPEQGLHELELARTLSPRDEGMWTMLLTTALSHFVAGRYQECVDWAERTIRNRPQVPMGYAAAATAHAHLGNESAAKMALRRMGVQQGALRLDGFSAVLRTTDREIVDRFLGGLRMAGLPGSLPIYSEQAKLSEAIVEPLDDCARSTLTESDTEHPKVTPTQPYQGVHHSRPAIAQGACTMPAPTIPGAAPDSGTRVALAISADRTAPGMHRLPSPRNFSAHNAATPAA